MVVVLLLIFVAIICWAWSEKRTQDFRAAEQLPLENDGISEPLNGGRQ
jgi:cbb3-type cytochrome oxidase subunit 3